MPWLGRLRKSAAAAAPGGGQGPGHAQSCLRSRADTLSSSVQLIHQGRAVALAALAAASPSLTLASVSQSSRSTCGLRQRASS